MPPCVVHAPISQPSVAQAHSVTLCPSPLLAPLKTHQGRPHPRGWHSFLLCGPHSRHALLQGTGLRGCEVTCPDGCIPPHWQVLTLETWGTHTWPCQAIAIPACAPCIDFDPGSSTALSAAVSAAVLQQRGCCVACRHLTIAAQRMSCVALAFRALLLFFWTLLLFFEVKSHPRVSAGLLERQCLGAWVCTVGSSRCHPVSVRSRPVFLGAAHRRTRIHTLLAQSALAA